MLKKMRRRFILAAMIAFASVMLVFAVGINVVNYRQTVISQDETLDRLYEYEVMREESDDVNPPPVTDMEWTGGPEREFTMRFFTVHCDKDGNVNVFFRDYISSVDTEKAAEYAKDILDSGKAKGYYDDYRYQVEQEDDEIVILFLNASESIKASRTLMVVTAVICAVSLLLIFGLILLLSGLAIRPFAKNIERQKRFITDAGHELKTPLTSIATSADIAAMEYEDDEWIANIQKQSVRMMKLVKDMITLSRLDEEIPFPEQTTFSLSEAAWEAAEPFRTQAAAAGLTCEYKIEEKLEYTGDRASIQHLISILLDNAVRYADKGGRISLAVKRQRGKIRIEVFNTCELPENLELSRIFDRFYRPDESRSTQTGGSGIGLSIAEAIVEACGGTITAESADGRSILFRAEI